MEELIKRLLDSADVIVVMGVVIGVMFRMLSLEKKNALSERKSHKKELKELNESNAKELKEKEQYIRERDLENIEVLTKIEAHLNKK